MIRDKERYSINYLIFRQPTEYFLLLLPFVIGTLATIYNIRSENINNFSKNLILEKNYELIDSYLVYAKYTLIVLIAFFICYRWSSMENDGAFGFWLTLGVNRTKFFIFSHLKVIGILYMSQLFGVLMILYLNSITMSIEALVLLNLLILSNLLVIIAIATLIGNLVNNPEIASLVYLGIMLVIVLLYLDNETIMKDILMSDLQYKTDTAIVSIFASSAFGGILMLISQQIFVRIDMEM